MIDPEPDADESAALPSSLRSGRQWAAIALVVAGLAAAGWLVDGPNLDGDDRFLLTMLLMSVAGWIIGFRLGRAAR